MDIIWIYTLLLLAGFFTGFINSTVGGGGMISVPTLLYLGVSSHSALATNKLQNLFGNFTAVYNFYKKGYLKFSDVSFGLIFETIGVVIGIIAMLNIDENSLNIIIVILLYILFIFMVVKRKPKLSDNKPLISNSLFYIIFGLVIGFYNGFFGPVTGAFWIIAFTAIIKVEPKKAVARTRALVLVANLVAFIILVFYIKIEWIYGIIMGVGQIVGGYLGSMFTLKISDKNLKRVFLIILAMVIIKITYDQFKGSF